MLIDIQHRFFLTTESEFTFNRNPKNDWLETPEFNNPNFLLTPETQINYSDAESCS